MSAQLIDGKAIALQIRQQIKEDVEKMVSGGKNPPGLGVLLVGDNPASRSYVTMKEKACAAAGIYSEEHTLPEDATEAQVLEIVDGFNKNEKIHGILVQLPLPDHIDSDKVLNAIKPEKDADGFHPYSVGMLWQGRPNFVACTPCGIMELIHSTGVEIKGKKAVIVGRSNIVGKPMAALLMAEHATITVCHSRTQDLPGECRNADILIAAIGRPKMVKGDWIKPGAVVIDVGINRVQDGEKSRLVGDVDFDEAKEVAGHLTPVPGGVGPMTIAMLLKNTLTAAQRKQG
jgi:methylenetetrahydrofolate dehydrogenase (NADP+)/methenyltetrahydrofolate cyclohydrolase